MTKEYVDLYDENRISINKKILRTKDLKEKVTEGYYLIAVVIIENQNKEFLLQKRSLEKGGDLALTGGHVKSGKTTLECIVEELKEELGITISKEEVTLVQTCKTENRIIDVFHLKKNIDISELIFQKEEVASAKYFTVEEIKKSLKDKTIRKSSRSIILDYLITNKD